MLLRFLRINVVFDGYCFESTGENAANSFSRSSGLSIRPHTQWSKLDQVKAFMKSLGLNPEELLVRNAISKPHRTVIDSEQSEQDQLEILGKALRNAILNGLTDS